MTDPLSEAAGPFLGHAGVVHDLLRHMVSLLTDLTVVRSSTDKRDEHPGKHLVSHTRPIAADLTGGDRSSPDLCLHVLPAQPSPWVRLPEGPDPCRRHDFASGTQHVAYRMGGVVSRNARVCESLISVQRCPRALPTNACGVINEAAGT